MLAKTVLTMAHSVHFVKFLKNWSRLAYTVYGNKAVIRNFGAPFVHWLSQQVLLLAIPPSSPNVSPSKFSHWPPHWMLHCTHFYCNYFNIYNLIYGNEKCITSHMSIQYLRGKKFILAACTHCLPRLPTPPVPGPLTCIMSVPSWWKTWWELLGFWMLCFPKQHTCSGLGL